MCLHRIYILVQHVNHNFSTLYLSYLAGKTQRRKWVEERCSDEGSSINSSSENDEELYDSAEDSAGSLKDFIVQSDIESVNGKNCR